MSWCREWVEEVMSAKSVGKCDAGLLRSIQFQLLSFGRADCNEAWCICAIWYCLKRMIKVLLLSSLVGR